MGIGESGFGININKYDLEMEGTLDSKNLAIMQDSDQSFVLDFNFINVDEEKKRDKLIAIGIGSSNSLEGADGVQLTFGAKLILSSIDNIDKGIDKWFSAMPLFAKIRYSLPPLIFNIPPVGIEGHMVYAPSVL